MLKRFGFFNGAGMQILHVEEIYGSNEKCHRTLVPTMVGHARWRKFLYMDGPFCFPLWHYPNGQRCEAFYAATWSSSFLSFSRSSMVIFRITGSPRGFLSGFFGR